MKNGAAQKKNTYHSNQLSQVIPFNDSVMVNSTLSLPEKWILWLKIRIS